MRPSPSCSARPQMPLAPSAATSTSAPAREPSSNVTAGRPSSSSSTVRTRAPSRKCRAGERGLLGQEGVEALALGHQHDRREAAVRERAEIGVAEADRRDLALDHRPDREGQQARAAQRDAAAARLVAGEARAVDEQRPHAARGEQVRGHRAGRPGADDDDVESLHDRSVRSRHGRQQRSSRGCRRPAGAPGHDRAAEVGLARRQRRRCAHPVRQPQEPPPARRRRRRPLRRPRPARGRAGRRARRGAAALARAPRLPDDRAGRQRRGGPARSASDAFDNRLVVVGDDGRLEGLLCLNKRDGYLCVDVRG